MDYFNIDLTKQYIDNINKKLIDEMDNITFEYDRLSREGDKLLQILEYSPKINKPDREEIKNLPKIEIPQLSELKKLDYSKLNSSSEKKNIPADKSNKEKFDIVKSILISIIDNALSQSNIKTKEEEGEEEFEKIMKKNKRKLEEEEKKKESEFSSTASRLGLEMNLLNQLKVYLFNHNDFILINITPKDNIKLIKQKIIQKIIDGKKYKLKNNTEQAYEIRIIEDDSQDEFVMGSSPLENDDSIFKEKITTIAFLENKNYISENLNKEELKFEEDDDENKVNIKIYYKKNGINNSKIFSLSKDDTLKTVLSLFFEENIFKDKNRDHYFFVAHNDIQDIDNEITCDTTINHLSSNELNLCKKEFFEHPEIINEYNMEGKKGLFNIKSEEILEEERGGNESESRFNEISGGLYQEFEVLKINKYKIKKKRILGIDMYYLYNNLPKKSNSGIMNILFKETKNPIRKIENIKECTAIGEIGFSIDIKNENSDEIKKLNYEVKSSDIRDEIVDKINFLIDFHKNNK